MHSSARNGPPDWAMRPTPRPTADAALGQQRAQRRSPPATEPQLRLEPKALWPEPKGDRRSADTRQYVWPTRSRSPQSPNAAAQQARAMLEVEVASLQRCVKTAQQRAATATSARAAPRPHAALPRIKVDPTLKSVPSTRAPFASPSGSKPRGRLPARVIQTVRQSCDSLRCRAWRLRWARGASGGTP